MWSFKCIFVANLLVFAIAQPIDNDLATTQNDKSVKYSPPPIEFPQNDSKFPVVDTNATLLHELAGGDASVVTQVPEVAKNNERQLPVQAETNTKPKEIKIDETIKPEVDESKIDTEVTDLLKLDPDLIELPQEPEHDDNVKNDIDSADKPANDPEPVPEEPIYITTTTENYPKSDVEWIQNGHDNEDVKLMADDDTVAPSNNYVREAYNVHGRGVPLVQGRYAAILAGIFIVLAVVGYAAMLSWRRYLENRYGNRQMLINEEDVDVYSTNDLKHFSL